MSTIFRSVLPAPPTSVVIGGAPAWGRYAGFIDRVDWDALQGEWGRSWLWRRLHHKRWQFIGIAARQVYVGIAVVDLGWAVTAFTYVFDRARKEVVVDWHQDGVPSLQGHVSDQPVKGARTWFRGWRSGLLMQHDGREDQCVLRTSANGASSVFMQRADGLRRARIGGFSSGTPTGCGKQGPRGFQAERR